MSNLLGATHAGPCPYIGNLITPQIERRDLTVHLLQLPGKLGDFEVSHVGVPELYASKLVVGCFQKPRQGKDSVKGPNDLIIQIHFYLNDPTQRLEMTPDSWSPTVIRIKVD